MQLKLKDFVSQFCESAIEGARAGTERAIELLENSEELAIDVPIADLPLHVEGASLTPSTILLPKTIKCATSGFLERDKDGDLAVTTKRRLMKQASVIKFQIEFTRSDPLQGLENARDRANEVNKEHIAHHRQQSIINAEKNSDQKET